MVYIIFSFLVFIRFLISLNRIIIRLNHHQSLLHRRFHRLRTILHLQFRFLIYLYDPQFKLVLDFSNK